MVRPFNAVQPYFSNLFLVKLERYAEEELLRLITPMVELLHGCLLIKTRL